MKHIYLIAIIFLTACATQQPRIVTTASGYPEAKFAKTSVSKVKSKIIQACDEKGGMIDTSESSVTCSKEMTGGDAALATFLIGNSYSTTPNQVVKFNIYPVGNDVKVSARQWIETQMAMGQIRKQELNSNNQFNDLQNMLYRIGGK